MVKLATICSSILVLLLAASTMLGFGFPWYMAVGLTLFGGLLIGILALAARLAIIDSARGDHHDH
ncbi:MAG: hypothetical protein IAI48_12070 [Candidatus Eremiobacteraeota bacterium]|nr:hypothetical protein [Candidatus Eremiobacteraeota bacterium]